MVALALAGISHTGVLASMAVLLYEYSTMRQGVSCKTTRGMYRSL